MYQKSPPLVIIPEAHLIVQNYNGIRENFMDTFFTTYGIVHIHIHGDIHATHKILITVLIHVELHTTNIVD